MEEKKIFIGTHNSMSYLKPSKWYMRPFAFIAKCQEEDIFMQLLRYDIVDLRISLDRDGCWRFRHGLIEYVKEDLFKILSLINAAYPGKVVRLMLEYTTKRNREYSIERFKRLCAIIEQDYPEIVFIGGKDKETYKTIYTFKHGIDIILNQFVSSVRADAKWYERLFPKLYAKRMNRYNYEIITEGYNLFDFPKYR